MKKTNTGDAAKRLIAYLLVGVLCLVLGRLTGVFDSFGAVFRNIHLTMEAVLRVIVMGLLVLAVENLIQIGLGLIKSEKRRIQTLVSISANALRYLAAVIILCWGLSILGADVGTIVAGMGILALIVGFGANSLIADMVTGIFMIFENQYNVGDYVEVGGFRGKVTKIGIRTTCLEDAGGNVKIINNSAMTNILNRSDHASRAVSVIGIPYETDLQALEEQFPKLLADIFARHGDIMLSEPVYLGVDELAASSVVLKFIAEVDDKNIYSAGRILNRELLLGLRSVGVEVPFPQLDVHRK